MDTTKGFILLGAVSVVVFLTSTPSAHAGLTNGDFSADFSGNTDPCVDWFVSSGTVSYWFGTANFVEDEEEAADSALIQIFTLDEGSQWLLFDVAIQTTALGESDVFSAYLLDPGDHDKPLRSVSGLQYFYSSAEAVPSLVDVSSSVISVDHPSLPDVSANRISLDVSGLENWFGKDVKLVFNLTNCDTTVVTNAFLDNVRVSLIPVPSTIMLATLGIGLVAWLRRRGAL